MRAQIRETERRRGSAPDALRSALIWAGLRALSAVSRRLASRSTSWRCGGFDRGARRGGVAVRGVETETDGGGGPLDECGRRVSVAVGPGGRRDRGLQQPGDCRRVDGDAIDALGHDCAAVFGLPGWPGEVGGGDEFCRFFAGQVAGGATSPWSSHSRWWCRSRSARRRRPGASLTVCSVASGGQPCRSLRRHRPIWPVRWA